VLAAGDKGFADVQTELLMVVNSGAAGRQLFEQAVKGMVALHVAAAIDARVAELLKLELVVSAQIDAARADMYARILEMPGGELLEARRDIVVRYGAVALAVRVESLAEELSLRIMAAVKAAAAASGALVLLANERYVTGAATPQPGGRGPAIAEAVLGPAVASRSRLNAVLGSAAIASADDVAGAIAAEAGRLTLVDETVAIELGLVDLVSGDAAKAGCLERILAALPSAEKAMAPEESLVQLEATRSSSAWRLAPRASQGVMIFTLRLARQLVEEVALELSEAKQHADAGAVVARFDFFVRGEADGELIFGRRALTQHLERLEALIEKGSAAECEAPTCLATHAWLLTPDERARAERARAALDAAKATNLDKLKAKSKGKVGKKKGGKAMATEDAAMQEALAFFT